MNREVRRPRHWPARKPALPTTPRCTDQPDAVPGIIWAIQTFGDLIHWHPPNHALVSEGVFRPEGTFVPLPKWATEPFLKLWEQEVLDSAALRNVGTERSPCIAGSRDGVGLKQCEGVKEDQSGRYRSGFGKTRRMA